MPIASRRRADSGALLVPFFLLAGAVACRPETPPAAPADEASLEQEYASLQRQATAQIRAWGPGSGGGEDPRRIWAETLERFARAHPGAAPAADALLGAMELRVSRHDADGFFAAYDELIRSAPDAPGLQGVFAQVTLMRMVLAGGPGIMQSPDLHEKKLAYRAAAPAIVKDVQRALDATRSRATKAAGHYAIGSTWYQMELDPARALEHFRIVADEYADWTYAGSAREYVMELETLAVGRSAPSFKAGSLRGESIDLEALKGKIVLVDFWATWCKPCVDELPSLRRAWSRYRKRGFVIVGVSLDTDVGAVRQFASVHGMDWPIIVSGAAMEDPIVRRYHVQGIPMSYLIDRDGAIRARALLGSDVERAVYGLLER